MMKKVKENLRLLFAQWKGTSPVRIDALPQSGSYRSYFRLSDDETSVIGVFNEDRHENEAFFSFTRTFSTFNLNVPELLLSDEKNNIYLLQDLGDVTLFSYLEKIRREKDFSVKAYEIYTRIIDHLFKFQFVTKDQINYDKAYPRASFDKQSILWDLNYFKYNFLKFFKIPFSEQRLENDFHTFSDLLLSTDTSYFMYRDFQSSNIMLFENDIYFIDYQGGRRGSIYYDLASLLYDAKAGIPIEVRERLVDYYYTALQEYIKVNRDEFNKFYQAYVLIRIMQAMGAYGFRGLYERKASFIKSISPAVKNLTMVLENNNLTICIPELLSVLSKITEMELPGFSSTSDKLTVRLYSFSYKHGIPQDFSGNGGGFVFDCRGIPNPGREEKFVNKSGLDGEVIHYLDNTREMQDFLQHVLSLSDQIIQSYISRKFNHLMICFGCTGGQHRSVYAAERVKKHLRHKFNIQILLNHREQQHWS